MKVITVVLMGLMMLALVACDISNADLEVTGPASVKKDENAWIDAIVTGIVPLMSIVEFRPYVDRDGDGNGDWNERLPTSVVAADRFGVAALHFGLSPEALFADTWKLPVPDEMEVIIYAEVYWSDPSDTSYVAKDSTTVKIDSSE